MKGAAALKGFALGNPNLAHEAGEFSPLDIRMVMGDGGMLAAALADVEISSPLGDALIADGMLGVRKASAAEESLDTFIEAKGVGANAGVSRELPVRFSCNDVKAISVSVSKETLTGAGTSGAIAVSGRTAKGDVVDLTEQCEFFTDGPLTVDRHGKAFTLDDGAKSCDCLICAKYGKLTDTARVRVRREELVGLSAYVCPWGQEDPERWKRAEIALTGDGDDPSNWLRCFCIAECLDPATGLTTEREVRVSDEAELEISSPALMVSHYDPDTGAACIRERKAADGARRAFATVTVRHNRLRVLLPHRRGQGHGVRPHRQQGRQRPGRRHARGGPGRPDRMPARSEREVQVRQGH